MSQNKIQQKLFHNKKKKGYIKKTKSNKIKDLLDHSKSKRLFRENFNQTFYQMNVLTKTQNFRLQQDQRAKTRANSRIKYDRLLQLCAPRKKIINLFETQAQQKSKTLSKSIQLRKQSFSESKQMPPIIFKSNLVTIEKRQQKKDNNKKVTQNTEMSDNEQLQQDFVKRELDKLQNTKIIGKQKLPIISTSLNKNWLNKIFDEGVYEDKYQEINEYLFKNVELYKQKGFNLEVKREWRF